MQRDDRGGGAGAGAGRATQLMDAAHDGATALRGSGLYCGVVTPDGRWHLPERLNMARQLLDHPRDKVAIIELAGDIPSPVPEAGGGADEAIRTVTYGRLGELCDAIAEALLARGVAAGDRVGVLFSQSATCAAAHLAIWKIGAISVPLFRLFREEALRSRIANSGAGLVVTDVAGAEQLAPLADLVAPLLAQSAVQEADARKQAEGAAENGSLPFVDTAADDPAVLIYTSGTTGKPKGALHGHRVLSGHLPGVSLSHDHLGQPGDCLWTPADWAWIGGLFDVLMPGLALGVPVVAARMEKFTPEECLRIIDAAGVRNVFFPPTALRMLKAADPEPDAASGRAGQGLRALRSVASGGEPLGAEMLAWGRRALGLAINEFYGQTECNMVASSCGATFEARAGCIGRPVPGHQIAILGPEGEVLEEGAGEGEVAIRRGSASMMLGYWQNPEATAAKFRGDWMLTGDRGTWEQGYLRFVGRDDDVITSAGYRIGPAEIEDCLLTHPAVATVGVVGKPDPLRTEIVKAYVVRKPGIAVDATELQDHVRSRLAHYSYPREITFLEALPMTVTGKVIRKDLKRRAAAEAKDTE